MEWHHLVGPLVGGRLGEVLLEAPFGGGPVGDGDRELELLLGARRIDILERVRGPRVVDRRVPFERELVGVGRAGVGVEGKEGERPALQREPGRVLRPVVGEAVFHRAGGVDVDEHRAPLVQPLEHAGDQVTRGRLGGLVHVDPTVRDGEEGQLLPHLGLPVLRLPEARHIGHLAGEAGGAGLPAGVGVDLGVEHHHPDRFPGRQEAGEVLEPDVEHRAVAAHREDRRAKGELVIGEAGPVEEAERWLVHRRLIGPLTEPLGAAHDRDVVGHLPHVGLEQPDGDRRGILEEVIDPGEGIRIVRIRAGPHRGTPGAVRHAQGGAAGAARSHLIAPLEVAQLAEGSVEPREAILRFEEDAGGDEPLDLRFERRDQRRQVGDVLRHPRLHRGEDRGDDEVHGGLLAAAHAGAVAADHRAVGGLLQQQGREHSDPFVDIGDVHEPVVGVGELLPGGPVAAEPGECEVILLHRHQGPVGADLHAEVAPFARLGVHRDREEAAGPFLPPFDRVEEGSGPGQREFGEPLVHLRHESVGGGAPLGVPSHLVGHRHVGAGERLGDGDGALPGEELLGLAPPRLDQGAERIEGPIVQRGHHRAEHLLRRVDEAGNRGVGTLGPALGAAGAVGRDEIGDLHPDPAHVTHGAGGRGDGADRGEGVGDPVLSQRAEGADLFPEAARVGDPGDRVDHIERLGDPGHRTDLVGRFDLARRHGEHLVEAAADDTEVVLDDRTAPVPELLGELGTEPVKEPRFGGLLLLQQRGGIEEGAEEGGSLHPVPQLDVGGLGAGDGEGVEDEDADVPFADRGPCPGGEREPECLGTEVALDHEDAPVGEAGQGVAVAEDVGVGGEHDIDVLELTVEPDRLVRQHGVEGRRLALLLGAVFRVRLDGHPEELEGGHREVLPHRDGPPPADGVDPHRGRSLGQEIHLPRRAERELAQGGVAVEHLFLPDLELRQSGVEADEVDAEVELPPPGTAGEHVVHRGDDVARLQVPAAEPEAARVEVGDLVGRERGHAGVGRRTGGAGAAILDPLRHRSADLSQQRRVDRERLVRPLEDHDPLLAGERPAHQIGREGAEHSQVEHPDLDASRLPEMIGDRLRVGHHRSLADDHILGVRQPVPSDARILPSGQGGELLEGLVGEGENVVEVERSLGRDPLGITVLVLHHAEHRRIVEVEHLRDAASGVAEHHPLGRRGTGDPVGGIAQVGLDELALGEQERFDDVRGEEAVLGDDPRVERQFGDPVGDQVQVGRFLHILGEELEESGVVDGVIVVVSRVDIEGVLGHGPRRDVEHVGESLADRGIERLVHIGDALAAREVRGTEPRHRHPGGDGGRGVLSFRFEEEKPAPVDVELPVGHRGRPSFAHLGRGGDGIHTGRFAGGGLHRHDRTAAVECGEDPRKSRCHALALPANEGSRANCAPSSQTIAPVGHRAVACGSAASMYV